jgi:tetratricopeptide (TPR) repeat protein
VYKAYIEQSQFFVGIYGLEYGWIDHKSGMIISGIHDEWRIATERNMPRLAFVLESNSPREPHLQKLIDDEIAPEVSYTPFSSSDQLIDLISDALKKLINDYIFQGFRTTGDTVPDYANALVEQYKSQMIFETSFFRLKLCPLLEKSNRVFVYGAPGTGKTVSLMLLAKRQNCVYVSLRNRSLLQVAGYLAGRVSQMSGVALHSYSSIDTAMAKCEQYIRSYPVLLLIDEVDQNIDLARALFSLNIGKGKIVFAGRRLLSDIEHDTVPIECTGFSSEEAAAYIKAIAPKSAVELRREAIAKSKGNPQYLAYYCSTYDQKPADTLDLYHARIYEQLSSNSREILCLLSLSETQLSMSDIAKALSAYRKTNVTGVAAENEVQPISHLVALTKGMLAVFHPAFREYVASHLRSLGLLIDLHIALSAIYDNPSESHFKTFHIVSAGQGGNVYKDLPEAERIAYLTGFVRIARRLYAEDIRLSKLKQDYFRLGYALYHASVMKKDSVGDTAALRTSTLAGKVFEQAGEAEWQLTTQGMSATFLVGLDRGDEAIQILKDIAEHFREEGLVYIEAVARTNLAFVYAKIGCMNDVETEGLRAKELHKSVGDRFGIGISLINLNNAYIDRQQNEKVLETCRQLQKLAKDLQVPRFEAAAQNGLTAYYRLKGKYSEAERAANRSIEIARELNDWDCVATNLGNLGNVYRDQDKFPDARACYEEVGRIGEKRKSTHHIAYARTSLAELAERAGDYPTAIKLGNEALELWKRTKDTYRVASACFDQAERILQRGGFDWAKAMPFYREAAEKYYEIGLHGDAINSYLRMIKIYLDHFNSVEASAIFSEALSKFASAGDSHHLCRLLNSLENWHDRPLDYINRAEVLEKSLQCLSSSLSKSEMFNLVRRTAAAFKRFEQCGKEVYLKFIRGVVKKYKQSPNERLATALAICVEQIPSTVRYIELMELFEEIGSINSSLAYRNEKWLDDQWLVFFDVPNVPIVEIRSSETLTTRVAAAVAAILLWCQKRLLLKEIRRTQWIALGWVVQALGENDVRKTGTALPSYFPSEFPICLASPIEVQKSHKPLTGMIVSDLYLTQVDYLAHPDNRCLIAFDLQLIEGLLHNFTNSIFRKKRGRDIRRKIITDIFDVCHVTQTRES